MRSAVTQLSFTFFKKILRTTNLTLLDSLGWCNNSLLICTREKKSTAGSKTIYMYLVYSVQRFFTPCDSTIKCMLWNQKHLQLSTPTVRRHAEACLSTTRAGNNLSAPPASGWSGVVPHMNYCEAWGGSRSRALNTKCIYVRSGEKQAIFQSNR